MKKLFWTLYRVGLWPGEVKETVLTQAMYHRVELQLKYTAKGYLEFLVRDKNIEEFDKIIEGVWNWYREKMEFSKAPKSNREESIFIKGTAVMCVHPLEGIVDIFSEYGCLI